MTPRNKSTLPARQRKAGAHQDGARRPEDPCSFCNGARVVEVFGESWDPRLDPCPACSGETPPTGGEGR
jgi:hypothetical protein